MQDLQAGQLPEGGELLHGASRQAQLPQQHMARQGRQILQRLADQAQPLQAQGVAQVRQIPDLALDEPGTVQAAAALAVEGDPLQAVGLGASTEVQLPQLVKLAPQDLRLRVQAQGPVNGPGLLGIGKAQGKIALRLTQIQHLRGRRGGGCLCGRG